MKKMTRQQKQKANSTGRSYSAPKYGFGGEGEELCLNENAIERFRSRIKK